MQSEALVDNDRRPRKTWVGSLSQTSFTGNFTVVPTDGWVTGFSSESAVDSGYSRSIPFVQWVPREYSGLIINQPIRVRYLHEHSLSSKIMEQIKHTYVEVNGLKLHVAEIGSDSSPAVVFLHGFPEIWYTWRHQMIAVANAGFRAIAPDYRGYGLSDIPQQPEKTSFADLVNDTAFILDYLAISKVHRDTGRSKNFFHWVSFGRFSLFFPNQVLTNFSHFFLNQMGY
ncbi:putative soluble epoxide hydrolase [Helianthus anomalus]